MRLFDVPISTLVEDPENARKHPARNLKSIKASLERFGQRLPLVVRDNVVVVGNGRLRVMKELGYESATVVRADDMTPEEARAFAVADNRTSELAEWDTERLKATLESFTVEGLLDGFEGLTDIMSFSSAELGRFVDVSAHERNLDASQQVSNQMTYSVIVDFDNETEQTNLLARLEGEGLKCRLLIA